MTLYDPKPTPLPRKTIENLSLMQKAIIFEHVKIGLLADKDLGILIQHFQKGTPSSSKEDTGIGALVHLWGEAYSHCTLGIGHDKALLGQVEKEIRAHVGGEKIGDIFIEQTQAAVDHVIDSMIAKYNNEEPKPKSRTR